METDTGNQTTNVSGEWKAAIIRIVVLVLFVALGFFLYELVQNKSNVACTVNPSSVTFDGANAANMSSVQIAEEIFAKYLEAHHIGGVCPEKVISGYKIDSVTIRKDGEKSFVANAVFEVSPFDSSNSSWFFESTDTEDSFVKNITRDFIVEENDGKYSILDVIE